MTNPANGSQSEPYFDRCQGLMAGLAIGNLLGIEVESWSQSAIARRHPSGIRDIVLYDGHPDDDDLAQALIVADAARQKAVDIHHLGRRFWEWAEVNGLGMGILTEDVLALYGGVRPARGSRQGVRLPRKPVGCSITEASKTAWNGERAGNGAVMRCAPLAIRWPDDSVELVRNSVLSAVPTHWDWRCGWSCALLNLAVAAALRGVRIDADELIRTAVEAVGASLPELETFGYEARLPDSVDGAVRSAANEGLGSIPLDGPNMGYTLLALRVGLSAHWSAERDETTFEDGLRTVVEAGGDTDTNGAVVGAVLGAHFGASGIPSRWSGRVAEIRSGRTPIQTYVARLLEA